MLLKEAVRDPKVLAVKQSFIDIVAKALDEAGIKYERKGNISLDIYNHVSRTKPIYVARAHVGGVDLVDDSAVRLATVATLPGYDRDDVLNVKTVDSRSSYNKLLAVPSNKDQQVFTKDSDYKAVYNDKTGHYEMFKPKHYYTGVKKIVDARETVYSPKKDMYLFGHNSFDKDDADWVLTNIDIIDNGHVVNVDSRKKKDQDLYDKLYELYTNGKFLKGEEQVEAVIYYITHTIQNTTVNAAESSGKNKYFIEPLEDLTTTLEKRYYNVKSNVDQVATDNAIRPFITLSPIKDIDLQITFARQGKKTYALISNTNKTLLYLDAKRNIDKINDPKYFDRIATVVIANFSKTDEYGRPLDKIQQAMNMDLSKNVAKAIDTYVEKWKSELARAAAIRDKTADFNKRRELVAQQQAKQQKKDAVRSQAIFKKQMDAALAQKDYEEKLKQQTAEDRARLKKAREDTEKMRKRYGEKPQEFFNKEVDDAFGGATGLNNFINGLVDRWDD